MRSVIKMPRVGENIDKVFIIEHLATVGEQIAVGQMLMSVETDKATIEIPSPIAGVLLEFLAETNQEIPVGAPIVALET